jgi:hypothetical protein
MGSWGLNSSALARDQWQAVLNTVMNFWFHKRWEISIPGERLLGSAEEIFSMELIGGI